MTRHDDSTAYYPPAHRLSPAHHRPAYTLIEILTATVLMIIIMMAVTVIFASVTDNIGQSRATLEMTQRLRATAAILKQDLENVTPVMTPPVHPRDNSGYFQYVEGPIGPVIRPSEFAWNTQFNIPDTTVGDIDDILMFTATTKGEPYIGLINGTPSISKSAEIIWFVRNGTLYRRVLLIRPDIDVRPEPQAGFYQRYDLSVRKDWDYESVPPMAPPGPSPSGEHRPVLKANSLADLTRPECRFAHQPDMRAWRVNMNGGTVSGAQPTPTTILSPPDKLQRNNSNLRYWREPKPFPHFLRPWLGAPFDANLDAPTANFKWVPGLGLPILAESSDPNWRAGDFLPTQNNIGISVNTPANVQMPTLAQNVLPTGPYDAWDSLPPWSGVNPLTGALLDYPNGTRIGDDVVLTNVLSFDVKAWDPNAPNLAHQTSNALNPWVILSPGDPGYAQEVALLRTAVANGDPFTTPPVGAYADLNYMARLPLAASAYPEVAIPAAGLPVPYFHRQGYPLYPDGPSLSVPLAYNRSLAYGTRWQMAVTQEPYCYMPAVYDTWSAHYEYNRQSIRYFSDNPSDTNVYTGNIGDEDGNGVFDDASNGLDDRDKDPALNAYVNGVDDPGERETQPPYGVPLQGIQIRIRTFEPGSRQIRETTIIQRFRTQ